MLLGVAQKKVVKEKGLHLVAAAIVKKSDSFILEPLSNRGVGVPFAFPSGQLRGPHIVLVHHNRFYLPSLACSRASCCLCSF